MDRADKEYATEDDKLSNFKRQAEMQGIEPLQVAVTFFLKHVFSIARGVSLREPMSGRIYDAINYLHLINALMLEVGDEAEATRQST